MIALISDTHMPQFSRDVPAPLLRGLVNASVEMILHAGDFTTTGVADRLSDIAPLEAVAGNNDPQALVVRFGRRKIVLVDQLRIGLVHGDGMHGTTLERAIASFDSKDVDMIMFGHSHEPYCVRHGAIWVFNPGSPCDKRRQPRFSYGLLDTATGQPQLFFYDAK
jgi:putative phosphoesterase